MTTLSEIQQNITAMTKVRPQTSEAWTSLAGQPSKHHYSDSDTNDEMPSKARKMTAVPPATLDHRTVMITEHTICKIIAVIVNFAPLDHLNNLKFNPK